MSEFVEAEMFRESPLYPVLATLFRSIDRDGSNSVSIVELLRVTFPHASTLSLQNMVVMSTQHRLDHRRKERIRKKGRVLQAKTRDDLIALFAVYDEDNNGFVSGVCVLRVRVHARVHARTHTGDGRRPDGTIFFHLGRSSPSKSSIAHFWSLRKTVRSLFQHR